MNIRHQLTAFAFMGIALASCNKCHDKEDGNGLGGKWSKTAEYSNSGWGQPFDWKTIFTNSVTIYLHENGLYSRIDQPSGKTITGSYIRTGNDNIIITNDATGEKETVGALLEDKNQLKITYNMSEGVQAERFVRLK